METERTDLWKHAYALAAFQDTRIFIEQLLEKKLTDHDPIRKSLSFSILITYARPFKQRKPVKLFDSIVPFEFREIHDRNIEMRDKVVAHRDLDGPDAEWGHISPVLFRVKNKTIQPITGSPVFQDHAASAMLPLLDHLTEKIGGLMFGEPRLREIVFSDGIYELEMRDTSKAWFSKTDRFGK